MLDSVVCTCVVLADDLVYCSPVRLPNCDLEAIYLGPSGIFAVAQGDFDPAAVYLALRDYLGTTRVEVYHGEKGRYNASGEPTCDYLPPQELDTAIYHHTTQGHIIWSEEDLNNIQKKIRILDGMNRGIYRDDDDNWYFVRGQSFYPCSEYDADHIFRLSLFGGVLGVHRFALGKWFTGLIYLLTGGLIGFGWLLDLLQIVSGRFRDRKKRWLSKPRRLRPSVYVGGIFCGLLLFCLYSVVLALLTSILDTTVLAAKGHIDADHAMWLVQLMDVFSVE